MMQNVKGKTEAINIDYSELYSKNEVAQFFSCLSTEIQDELLSVMREMVAKNKAAQDQQ